MENKNENRILPKESYETIKKNSLNESKKPNFTSNNDKFVKKLEEALGKKVNPIKKNNIVDENSPFTRMMQISEYNVIEGKPFEPLYKETGFIGEEDPIPDPESVEEVPTIEPETPVETDPVDTENQEAETNLQPKSNPLSFEELTDKKLTVLKDIVTVQKEKIDQIFDYIEVLGNEVEELIRKSEEIDVLNDKATQMQSQIDFLTPPTAEESLGKMVKIGNGYTIDDYWKNWLEKNQGKEVVGQIPYYQNGVTTNKPAEVKLPTYSEDDVKKSLGLK